MTTNAITVKTWEKMIDALFEDPDQAVTLTSWQIDADDRKLEDLSDFLYGKDNIRIENLVIMITTSRPLAMLQNHYIKHLIDRPAFEKTKITIEFEIPERFTYSPWKEKKTIIQMAVIEGRDSYKRDKAREKGKQQTAEGVNA